MFFLLGLVQLTIQFLQCLLVIPAEIHPLIFFQLRRQINRLKDEENDALLFFEQHPPPFHFHIF